MRCEIGNAGIDIDSPHRLHAIDDESRAVRAAKRQQGEAGQLASQVHHMHMRHAHEASLL